MGDKYKIDSFFLARWTEGNLTNDELEFFKTRPEYDMYLKIFNTSTGFVVPNFNKEKVYDKIQNNILNKPNSKRKFTKNLNILSGIAASLLLFIGIYYLGFVSSNEQLYVTGNAEKQDIILPDGSKVSLNAASKLSFDKSDFIKNRKLYLEGEAFFEVAKGAKFSVISKQGSVTVLGTKFNIIDRPKVFEATCFEGKVRVENEILNKKLTPNMGVRVFNDLITNIVSYEPKPSWISNISTFKKVPLVVVLNDLENQFDIHIKASKIDKNQIITTFFEHNDLTTALETIFKPLNIKYIVLKDNTIILE